MRSQRAWLICWALVGAWALAAGADESPIGRTAGAEAVNWAEVDLLLEVEMVKRRIPGLAMAIVRHGAVVRATSYGFADLEESRRATPETPFLIASITKTFTSVAVLTLVEEGKVDLDDPIGKYVEQLPQPWRAATVRQLLQHTSGINSFTAHETPPCPTGAPATQPRDAIAEVACLPLDFEPGTAWSYSDTGYLLLGLLIEARSGQSYADALRERIFAPLGMEATHLLGTRAVAAAIGYERGLELRPGPQLEGGIEFASGGLVSTVLDLARWAAALGSPEMLTPATWASAWTPAAAGDAEYGMGFALKPVAGRRHVGHSGGGPSAATVLAHFPDEGVSIILLTNTNQPRLAMRELAERVAELVLPQLPRIKDPAQP